MLPPAGRRVTLPPSATAGASRKSDGCGAIIRPSGPPSSTWRNSFATDLHESDIAFVTRTASLNEEHARVDGQIDPNRGYDGQSPNDPYVEGPRGSGLRLCAISSWDWPSAR